jgi:16S rRNA processing protein RimM
VGIVVAAHGLGGDVRVQPTTDFPARLHELQTVWVAPAGKPATQARVRRVADHTSKSLMVFGLKGVTTRGAAQDLVGAELQIELAQASELPADTYYEHDIIGLTVVTTEGLELGPITDVLRTGANDVYVTERCLVPAIADVVKEIDLAGGRMVIEAIRGLLDE